MEISPPISVKKIFEGFSPYIGHGDASWSYDQHPINKFSFLCTSMYLKAYIQNLVKNNPVISEKSMFSFSYINGLGQRSRNDLDLQYIPS